MQAIQDLRVTNSILVPAMIGMLVNSPTIADYDLTSFSSLLYGGQSISEAVLRRAFERLPGCGFTQAYGMTELSPVATFLSPRYHATDGPDAGRLRAAGRAAATVEIRIADEEDREVPRGTVGQILVRGPIVMKGYWNQPALTADGAARRLDAHRRRRLHGRRGLRVRRGSHQGHDHHRRRERLLGRGRERDLSASGGRHVRGDRRAGRAVGRARPRRDCLEARADRPPRRTSWRIAGS